MESYFQRWISGGRAVGNPAQEMGIQRWNWESSAGIGGPAPELEILRWNVVIQRWNWESRAGIGNPALELEIQRWISKSSAGIPDPALERGSALGIPRCAEEGFW